jgi:hypothetical protein
LPLKRAWLALFDPLHGLIFDFRGGEVYYHLVHFDNFIQHRHVLALYGANKGNAGPNALFLQLRTQKLRDISGGLLFKSHIVVKDAMDCINEYPMGSSKNLDALASIFLNNGGDRGDEAGGRDRFLQIEMVLVIRVFSGNSFFQDDINCSLLQGLVP